MILVLAEKEEVAQALSSALPDSDKARKERGVIKQGSYYITWLSGHMLELKSPEDYDPALKEWTIEQLPINFTNWGVKPKEGDANKLYRLKMIKEWMAEAEYLIHAGDPDQEGQLLVDEVLRLYKNKKKVLRINTSDTTTLGLKKAFANMEDNKDYESGGWSAYARTVADFMIGINMSRLFTRLNDGVKLTVGRVQTPTLGLVVARDQLIEGHQKIVYYIISGNIKLSDQYSTLESVKVRYTPPKTDPNLVDGRILDKAYAEAKIKELIGTHLSPISITKKIVEEQPPLPFNMVKLQTYCNNKFGMSLEQTMETTQSLRDKHSAITYNRSDCQYLPENIFKEAPQTMATVVQNIKFKPKALDTSIKSKCFNDAEVKLHFAIIPQDTPLDLANLTPAEKNVYLAIAKYYMAQFMPPAKKEVTKLSVTLPDGGTLTATSTTILSPGYRSIFKELGADEASELSQVPAGSYSGTVIDATAEEKETKPPARYTQASLAEDMTCIAKYVNDPRIKQMLKEKDKDSKEDNGSIGTVATRTPIIVGLIKKGFLEDDGKHLKSTELGRELFRILPNEVKAVDMTAEWWAVCESIVAGTATPQDLQDNVLQTIKDILANQNKYPKVDKAIVLKNKTYGGKVPLGFCPRCQSPVIEGKMGYGCTAWKSGCKFVLWKKPKLDMFQKTTIKPSQAKSLLDGKKVKFDSLWSKTKNTEFTGYLTMDDSEQANYGPKLALSFDAPKKGTNASERKTPKRKNPERKAPSRKVTDKQKKP